MYAFEPCSIEFNDGYKIVYKSINNTEYKIGNLLYQKYKVIWHEL